VQTVVPLPAAAFRNTKLLELSDISGWTVLSPDMQCISMANVVADEYLFDHKRRLQILLFNAKIKLNVQISTYLLPTTS
jgi:hypothetical protein